MGTRKFWDNPGDAHELTFTCYQRRPLFEDSSVRDQFVGHLATVKAQLELSLLAYVVMPEHVHLLVWSKRVDVPKTLSQVKSSFAFYLLKEWKDNADPRIELCVTPQGDHRFWQAGGGYDRNIFSPEAFEASIAYIHNNPVKRGLVQSSEEWLWSSAMAYFKDDDSGIVTLWSRS